MCRPFYRKETQYILRKFRSEADIKVGQKKTRKSLIDDLDKMITSIQESPAPRSGFLRDRAFF